MNWMARPSPIFLIEDGLHEPLSSVLAWPILLLEESPAGAAWAIPRAPTPRGNLETHDGYRRRTLALNPLGEVRELRVVLEESQLDLANRPVAMLRNVNLGDALLRRVGVIDLIAIDEDH